jgi:hypothetical protein
MGVCETSPPPSRTRGPAHRPVRPLRRQRLLAAQRSTAARRRQARSSSPARTLTGLRALQLDPSHAPARPAAARRRERTVTQPSPMPAAVIRTVEHVLDRPGPHGCEDVRLGRTVELGRGRSWRASLADFSRIARLLADFLRTVVALTSTRESRGRPLSPLCPRRRAARGQALQQQVWLRHIGALAAARTFVLSMPSKRRTCSKDRQDSTCPCTDSGPNAAVPGGRRSPFRCARPGGGGGGRRGSPDRRRTQPRRGRRVGEGARPPRR